MQAAPLTELWTQCEISRSQSIDPTRTLFDASVGHGLLSGLHSTKDHLHFRKRIAQIHVHIIYSDSLSKI